ncbi:GNAT family N-acetyltransferase [Clostridium botulinum]|uniref:GNAT family N-acetyltransferase n=1 Tax=Clostridium botulinum TaxID=1491 RepID=UPI0007740B1A|nr:GNAT family N-acetyltransferase [Clostridium botulinum]MBY6929595.1 GNAT family N-acetyltransferase [Clostridium botulinum]NFF81094.1 GNAT family N-acetyltransferase [Clostridium botulinum]NFG21610.1 GNAT family N-acetyltransferase [Clostridium botulinum]NFO82579.1 GNAT family N-acetyltransferase [Clostridium botulinum]HBJ1647982.1 GNAT family N-acetyltransferase [Clostridium botulinum]
MNIIIETKDLILRNIKLKDLNVLHEIRNEEYILKWMPDWKSTKKETKQWIYEVIDFYDKQNENDLWCQLVIEKKSDNTILGIIALQTKFEVNNEIEIAYFISEKYSGKGYMKQAAKAILEWGFDNYNFPFVMAIVEIDNYPSQKVIECVGFKKVETRMILNSGEEKEKPFFYYKYNKKINHSKN